MTEEPSFEEYYPVKKEYKQFDPRNTAFARAARMNLKYYSTEARKVERIKQGQPGFTLVDYAFKDAALTAAQASHSGRGTMNSGFYSWAPLGVTKKPESIPRLEETPQRTSQIVKKAGKYYGASGIGFCKLDKKWVYSHTQDGRKIVFEDVEKGYVDSEKAVIPNSHQWVVAITVPMEVEEMMFSPLAITP